MAPPPDAGGGGGGGGGDDSVAVPPASPFASVAGAAYVPPKQLVEQPVHSDRMQLLASAH